jgi:hypothetical protein
MVNAEQTGWRRPLPGNNRFDYDLLRYFPCDLGRYDIGV